MTSSPTQSWCWTPSTWLRWGPSASMRSAAACSRRPPATRGRKGDPLFGIQTILRAGADNLSDRQIDRIATAIEADERHQEVYWAWRCAQDLRAAYRETDLTKGRQRAEALISTMTSCPIPEVARLGRTLRRWRDAFLAYFTTDRSSNGGTEAVNGIIELHRRIARGYRNFDNYRLRMLLVAGGLTP